MSHLGLVASNEVILDDVRKSKLKFRMHMNFGGKGSKYVYVGETFPRLTIVDTYIKKERRTVRAAYVDGERMMSWAEVVAALNQPAGRRG